jgi:hypothetical protein
MRNRYSAYLNFDRENKYNVLECGVRIRNFEDADYGTWRCDIRIPYSLRVFGAMLHVDYPNSSKDGNIAGRRVKITADDVYVKRGDSFTVNSRKIHNTRRFTLLLRVLCAIIRIKELKNEGLALYRSHRAREHMSQLLMFKKSIDRDYE